MTPAQALACIEQERLDVLAEGMSEADCNMVAAYVLASAYRKLMFARPEATRVEALDKVTNVVRSYDYESPNKVLPYVVVFFPDSDYASRDKFAASLTPSPLASTSKDKP